jgi:hypothetical protein
LISTASNLEPATRPHKTHGTGILQRQRPHVAAL